ncbi:hypothetical protein ALC60_11404 [Trachymyrmex zeteki]|uniref:DUF8207 domain-containing protein n=1 Tax=Mycetomoellerius zeteki TaxID=64791 RepID=A0A151WNY9_9HYME|nr:hypothetical protein ALC60_11404 [Trachymyrmex zeteki]
MRCVKHVKNCALQNVFKIYNWFYSIQNALITGIDAIRIRDSFFLSISYLLRITRCIHSQPVFFSREAKVISRLDGKVQTDKEIRKHDSMLSTFIRAIVCGPSNCGKTNVLISLLESPHGVRFKNVYVYSKSLQQLKYEYLANLLTPIEEIGYFTFSNNSDVISPTEELPNSIFIFDDMACEKQDAIKEYFAMSRHARIDCFYQCQTYAKIPKHLIRDNANLLILFKQDCTNLKRVYNDHVNTDMSYEDSYDLCHKYWQQKYGFLVIDKDSALNKGRYRKGTWGFDPHRRRGTRGTLPSPSVWWGGSLGAPRAKRVDTDAPVGGRSTYHGDGYAVPYGESWSRSDVFRGLGPRPLTPIPGRLGSRPESATSTVRGDGDGRRGRSELFRDASMPRQADSPRVLVVAEDHPSSYGDGQSLAAPRAGEEVERGQRLREARQALRVAIREAKTRCCHERSARKWDGIDRVYLHKDGLMFGNKRFDVDDADSIIIDGVRYAGTPGLYELIFKRIPDDLLYTEDNMHKYKSILLATNAHRHKYHSQGRVLANRGYK